MLGAVARIRIVDEWLRSPISPPTRQRAVFVVADSWSEQRVLMRAYAGAPDQTRPTIALRDREFEIGPAGSDPHGPWGIRIEQAVEGRPQELRAQLEEAARRLAGARRSPPRLEDEESPFEKAPTRVWVAPDGDGSARVVGNREAPAELGGAPAAGWEAQPGEARPRRGGGRETKELFPGGRLSPADGSAPRGAAAGPSPKAGPAGTNAEPRGPTGKGRAPSTAETLTGVPTRPPAPGGGPKDGLAAVVGRTMPLGFELSASEREVLNALGRRGELTEREVAELASASDGAGWMESFVARLAEHGLDLVIPGDADGGGRVFALRH